jgi:hypothetical protein
MLACSCIIYIYLPFAKRKLGPDWILVKEEHLCCVQFLHLALAQVIVIQDDSPLTENQEDAVRLRSLELLMGSYSYVTAKLIQLIKGDRDRNCKNNY